MRERLPRIARPSPAYSSSCAKVVGWVERRRTHHSLRGRDGRAIVTTIARVRWRATHPTRQRSPSCAKEIFEQRGRRFRAEAGLHVGPVVAGRGGEEADSAGDGATFGIGGAIIERADARE